MTFHGSTLKVPYEIFGSCKINAGTDKIGDLILKNVSDQITINDAIPHNIDRNRIMYCLMNE